MKKVLAVLLILSLLLSVSTAFAAGNMDKETVKKVQAALNDAGYNCGTPDGIAGKMTEAAISAYQLDNGLEATGEITYELLAALFPAVDVPVVEQEDEPEGKTFTLHFDGKLSDLPADVATATGGIPDSLKNVPEKYDITEAVAYYRQMKLSDAMKSLMENGNCEFPLPKGEIWMPESDDYIRMSAFGDDCEGWQDLEVSIAADRVIVTLTTPLPEDIFLIEFFFDYSKAIEIRACIERGSEGEFSTFTVQITDVIETDSGNGSYYYTRTYEDGWDGILERVWISLIGQDGKKVIRDWEGIYDPDTGDLINKLAYDRK